VGENARPSRFVRGLVVVAAVTMAVVAVPLVFHVVVHLPYDRRAARLRREMEARSARYRHEYGEVAPYRRPVLRGKVLPGNAADAAMAAAAPLRTTDPWSFVTDEESIVFESGRPPPSERLQRLAQRHAGMLDALRRATQRGWSFVDLDDRRTIDQACFALSNACALLIVQALDAPPGECLAIIADALRLAQDMENGCPLYRCTGSGVFKMAARCAERAAPEEIQRAAGELERLARDVPPWNRREELQRLLAAQLYDETYGLHRWLPTDAEGWQQLDSREPLLNEWAAALHTAPRTIRECRGLDLSECEVSTRVRLMGVALYALAAAAASGGGFDEQPPDAIRSIGGDPFDDDAPLRYRVDEARRNAWVYSVGYNGRDDGGQSGTDDIRIRVRAPRHR
jgi:hypothetical protein